MSYILRSKCIVCRKMGSSNHHKIPYKCHEIRCSKMIGSVSRQKMR